jgi:alcohol dehydrogenase
MIIRAHGELDRLVYDERFPDPHPGPGEVVVAVRATSLNYHDVFTLRGMPGIKIPMPAIMGLDLAGEIAELGPGVEDWTVGDRVLVDPIDRVRGGLMGETIHGGLAERCRAGAHQLIRIPAGVTFADAAALPVAYGTAHRMMVTQGKIAAGERVLILGASGGVGTCCVFLAKKAGATVIACASSDEKIKRLYALGADHVIDYTREDFADGTRRYDLILDIGGSTPVRRLRRALRPRGTLVFVGGENSGNLTGLGRQLRGALISPFLRQRLVLLVAKERATDLERLTGLIEDGKVIPSVDRSYPLDEAPDAMRLPTISSSIPISARGVLSSCCSVCSIHA